MQPWWGTSEIALEAQRRWQIGSTVLWVERLPSEWRVAWEGAADNGDAGEQEPAADDGKTSLLERQNVARFGVENTEPRVTLLPALADRPVVSRPEKPFGVPPNQTVTVFIGTPLWFQVRVGSAPEPLLDAPIVRPSDTWFGPNTRTGELCYASRTHCRLRLDDLPITAQRAFTAVTIRNQSAQRLELERVKLPVVYLGLYVSGADCLWTEHVELTHEENVELAPLRIGSAPPEIAGKTKRVAAPRQRTPAKVFERVFSTLFA